MLRLMFALFAAVLPAGATEIPEGRILIERASARGPAPAAAARPAEAALVAPWVRRQQEVVAEARVADVVIEASALALADGREGDVIQVRLASGGPIRPGRVIAPGRVAL